MNIVLLYALKANLFPEHIEKSKKSVLSSSIYRLEIGHFLPEEMGETMQHTWPLLQAHCHPPAVGDDDEDDNGNDNDDDDDNGDDVDNLYESEDRGSNMGEINNRTSLAKLGSWHLDIIIVGYRFVGHDDDDKGDDDDDDDDGEPHQ